MQFENSRDIVASYEDSSSYSSTTINNYITNSFNRTHTGNNIAGGVCGLLVALVVVASLAGLVVVAMMVMEVLI